MPHVVNKAPDPTVVKRTVCRGCGATIEYVPNDVKTLYSGRDISGGSDGAEGFPCPNCSKNIVIRSW